MPDTPLTFEEAAFGETNKALDAMVEQISGQKPLPENPTLPIGNKPDPTPPAEDKAAKDADPSKDGQAAEKAPAGDDAGKPKDEPKKVPEVDTSRILKKLGLTETEPETIEFWKKKASDHSRGATMAVNRSKAMEGALKAQGVEPVEINGEWKLVASKEVVEDFLAKDAKDILSGLTDAERELAVDDPDKFAATLLEKAASTMKAHPKATASSDEIQISDEVCNEVSAAMANATDDQGNEAFPLWNLCSPIMEKILNDPSTPEEFSKAMLASKEAYAFGLKLLHAQAHGAIIADLEAMRDADEKAAAEAAEKQKKAEDDPHLRDDSGKFSNGSGGGSADSDEKRAMAIINAKPVW